MAFPLPGEEEEREEVRDVLQKNHLQPLSVNFLIKRTRIISPQINIDRRAWLLPAGYNGRSPCCHWLRSCWY